MADYTQAPRGGAAPHVHPEYAVAPDTPSFARLTNLAGAAVSLALVVGVGVWGYKLLVRDVSGIPVVRAAEGEMRVRPQEPGGDFAEHQGLAVNTIAAIGTSAERAQSLRLAPQPTDLAEEDAPMPELAEATSDPELAEATLDPELAEATLDPELAEATLGTELAEATLDTALAEASSGTEDTSGQLAAPAADPLEVPEAAEIAAALESGSVDSIVAQLTNGVVPLDALEGESAPVLASVSAQDVGASFEGTGLQASLRPAVRPARAAATEAAPAPAAAPFGAAVELDADAIPVGTRLVQLGAFDTPEIARAQWGTLSQRFGPFMEGKDRIVMEAQSGGRTFYRLRAAGFEDIGDARRFCSALVAESVDCIPVVTR